jgi:hypothetical protein
MILFRVKQLWRRGPRMGNGLELKVNEKVHNQLLSILVATFKPAENSQVKF